MVAKRLNLFVKGNVDVHDSLHSCRLGGQLKWNGINEVLRTGHPGVTIRLKHETSARSDNWLQATGEIPEALRGREFPLGSHTPEIQFSRALFDTTADAIVLSIQPDVTLRAVRHRKDGFILYLNDRELYSMADRAWIKEHFEESPRLTLEQSMTNLAKVAARIREKSEAPILIYNMSPILPGDWVHNYQGLDDLYSTRIKQFNLGLIDLSAETGISIVDVEQVLARKGAEKLKVDWFHLTPEGYRYLAEEVVRILTDLGVL